MIRRIFMYAISCMTLCNGRTSHISQTRHYFCQVSWYTAVCNFFAYTGSMKLSHFIFSEFFVKSTMSSNSTEIIKLDSRSFCRCHFSCSSVCQVNPPLFILGAYLAKKKANKKLSKMKVCTMSNSNILNSVVMINCPTLNRK